MPYLQIDDDVAAARASGASHRRTATRYDDTTKCILCAACTTSCPVVLGPADVRRPGRDRQRPPVHLRLARRRGADERLEILADADGVWRCRTIFNCTDACPRGINITRAILEVSSAIVERRA